MNFLPCLALKSNLWTFSNINHFLLSGSYLFLALTVVKDFFSKTSKTPKTAENRDTIKTKVVELGIIFHMHPFKIWKNEKKISKKKFYQNDIEKKFFGEKNQKSNLIHQNDGIDE